MNFKRRCDSISLFFRSINNNNSIFEVKYNKATGISKVDIYLKIKCSSIHFCFVKPDLTLDILMLKLAEV